MGTLGTGHPGYPPLGTLLPAPCMSVVRTRVVPPCPARWHQAIPPQEYTGIPGIPGDSCIPHFDSSPRMPERSETVPWTVSDIPNVLAPKGFWEYSWNPWDSGEESTLGKEVFACKSMQKQLFLAVSGSFPMWGNLESQESQESHGIPWNPEAKTAESNEETVMFSAFGPKTLTSIPHFDSSPGS